MHRIRTWARAKAHGQSPSTTGRTNSGLRTSSSLRTPTGLSAGSRSTTQKSNGVVPDNGGDNAVAAEGESEKTKLEKKGVATRFYYVFRTVLLSSWVNVLLVFVPVGIAVKFAGLSAGIIFAMNAIAIIPLAGMLSYATESVARKLGDTIGALMNVTFGNAVELIIFIIALVKNEIRIVQASLLGSILANLLLILGMCMVLGGLRYREQLYNSTVTQMSACLLSLSVISLLLPTAFHASFSDNTTADTQVLKVSRGTSVILLLVYFLYLLFQLNSHSYMYQSTPQHIIDRESHPGPAAHYWDSSSSSDSDSSSSSDSDSSSKSVSTVKKFKRALKGGRKSRKQSVASADAEKPGQISSPISPASPGTEGSLLNPLEQTGSAPASSSHTPAGLQLTEEAAEALEQAQEGKKKKRKHKHHHRKHKRAENGDDNVPGKAAVRLFDGADNAITKRVDFALAPDLEAQVDGVASRPSPKSFLLRTLGPNVFSNPPTDSVQGPAGPTGQQQTRPSIRRTRSMPTHQSYRAGAVPPIVPITVNGAGSPVEEEEHEGPELSRTSAILLLLISTGLVALCAEFMVDSISDVVSGSSGISEAFIGLILLPIVGNAAEHVTAVTVAVKNKMDLAIGVALGSSIQIALFVTPLVVILGWMMGKDMSLFFTLFETISLFVSAFIVNFLVLDGRSNYLEGSLLCAAYVIIAVAAFFYPNSTEASSIGGGESNSTSAEDSAKLMVRGMASMLGWQ